MQYYCDNKRHLICTPYSIENLHKMALDLNINRAWFHSKNGKSHYDIPKTRVEEIKSKCRIISTKQILNIIRNGRT